MKRHHKILIAVASAATIGLGAASSFHHATPVTKPTIIVNPSPQGNHSGPDYLYPDPVRTPGETNPDINQGNISQNICAGSLWSTKSIRPPATYTTALKVQQLAGGYTYQGDTNTASYEEDHLISLELGGNPTSEFNLWPEPYHTQVNGTEVGAKQKDSVENNLHKELCAGTITLARAQQIITSDWYSCFLSLSGHNNCL